MRKLALALALTLPLALVACQGGGEEAAGPAPDLEDEAQRASYAQGYQIGSQGQEFPIDVDAFMAGIRDGFAGEGQLEDAELQTALEDFARRMTEATSAASSAEAEANVAEGEAFLAENAERPEVRVTESGLQYEVIREGDGPRPAADDTVTVHYTGTLIDGTEFDSSRDGEPVSFPLQGVIPGWSEGVQLMPEGSIYKLYMPGSLAYGDQPQPGSPIGPQETLIFEVELLDIVEERTEQQ